MKVNHIVTVCLLFLLACADAGLAQRAKSKPKRKRQNLEEQLWTPLMQAAQEGRITTVRHLLRKGVDVNGKNGQDESAEGLSHNSAQLCDRAA